MAVWPAYGTVAMVGVPRLVRALLRVVVLWLVIPRILRTTHDIEQQHERAQAHRDQRPPLVPALPCRPAATRRAGAWLIRFTVTRPTVSPSATTGKAEWRCHGR